MSQAIIAKAYRETHAGRGSRECRAMRAADKLGMNDNCFDTDGTGGTALLTAGWRCGAVRWGGVCGGSCQKQQQQQQ